MCSTAADHPYCLFKFCNEVAGPSLFIYVMQTASLQILIQSPSLFCRLGALMAAKEMFAASYGTIRRKLFPKKFLSPDGGGEITINYGKGNHKCAFLFIGGLVLSQLSSRAYTCF